MSRSPGTLFGGLSLDEHKQSCFGKITSFLDEKDMQDFENGRLMEAIVSSQINHNLLSIYRVDIKNVHRKIPRSRKKNASLLLEIPIQGLFVAHKNNFNKEGKFFSIDSIDNLTEPYQAFSYELSYGEKHLIIRLPLNLAQDDKSIEDEINNTLVLIEEMGEMAIRNFQTFNDQLEDFVLDTIARRKENALEDIKRLRKLGFDVGDQE